jgi:hypothetical protein
MSDIIIYNMVKRNSEIKSNSVAPPTSTPGTGTSLGSWPGLEAMGKSKIHCSLSILSKFIDWKMLLAAGVETNS